MQKLLAIVLLTGLVPAQDQVHYPTKPGPREFVLDEAHLLSPEKTADIRKLCEEALNTKQAPIIVVTIPSLADYGASGWPIERYAMNLMAEWGVGWPEWNYGMLLLVSPGDRKARIELGGSWQRRKDEAAQRVMSEQIIPYFKEGKMAEGILAGVRGLHAIAMDLAPPSRTASPGTAPVPGPGPGPASGHGMPGLPCGMGIGTLVVLGILAFVVLRRVFRGGTSSWGSGGPGMLGGGGYGGGGFGRGLGGGLLGGALGSMIGNAISNRSRGGGGIFGGGGGSGGGGGGGGSFGGGSFGGGFSGGGGATGSW